MSHIDPLPPELADLESHLRGLPLPPGKFNRDETLYRAGWAAAEAHCRKWGGSRMWPVISGVLAASVLILGALLVRQGEAPQVADVDNARPVQPETPHGLAHGSAPEMGAPSNETRLPLEFAPRFAPAEHSLLALRDRALLGVLPDLSDPGDQGDAPVPRAKTRRELLTDLLERNFNS